MALERKRSSRRSNYRYQPKKKTPGSRCKTCCRKFMAFMFSHVGLCGLVVGYSILGAFAFRYIEESGGHKKTSEVNGKRTDTVENLWKITYRLNILYKDNWTNEVTEEIMKFQNCVIQAVKEGYDGNDHQQWSLSRAFLYSLTVITTIGYGNIAPRTNVGKLVTVLYAIVGIPLMLLYLTNIGDILAKSFKYLYSRMCQCGQQDAFKRRRPNENYRAHHVVAQNSPNKQNAVSEAPLKDKVSGVGLATEDEVRIEAIPDAVLDGEDEYEKPLVTVPITLCLVILVGYICGGAVLFHFWEKWDFLTAAYFCFVTLSTIGFGDFVPGDTISGESHDRLVLCSLYLLVGMAIIAMCFNLMQEEVIHKVRSFGIRIGIIKAQDDEVD